tara:strand:- start:1266 stop:1538 length:273 start_codon:yes stop_codon:yes gene_type:complete
MIFYSYSGLFGGVVETDDEDEIDLPAPTFSERWKWYSIVERLSNGDITRFSEILEQPYVGCLNLLSYWKERDDYQRELQKRQDTAQKHRR